MVRMSICQELQYFLKNGYLHCRQQLGGGLTLSPWGHNAKLLGVVSRDVAVAPDVEVLLLSLLHRLLVLLQGYDQC